MPSVDDIKKLCKKYNIYPVRSKGQNFLIKDDALELIEDCSGLNKKDIILEVGPGFGFLTERLSRKVKKVIGVEIDGNLYKAAKDKLGSIKNIEIINEDILKLSDCQINKLMGNEYKIIANLPYSITGIFLRKFLSSSFRPREMYLMLQKEVAERICAGVGKMSVLGVCVQYYSESEIVKNIEKDAFYPAPKVESAIVKIIIKKEFLELCKMDKDTEFFFRIVKVGFSARRKMLKNNLFAGFKGMGLEINLNQIEYAFLKCELSIKARPQDLSVDDWKKLIRELKM